MIIHSIPGKMETSWLENVKSILDTWTTYNVSLEEFRESVLIKGIDYSKKNGGIAWIVDSSEAVGVFSREIQAFIGTDIFPAFAVNGVKYFITITSKKSALTEMTVSAYSEKAGPSGLTLVEADSVTQAIEFLKQKI
jgi:hypothetical protein